MWLGNPSDPVAFPVNIVISMNKAWLFVARKQANEDPHHMMHGCSFSRQVWHFLLVPDRLHRFTTMQQIDNVDWWTSVMVVAQWFTHPEISSLVAVGLRFIWLERNIRVFDKIYSPSEALRGEQGRCCSFGGRRGMTDM